MNFKKEVYLFTTENISGYIADMDLKDKSLLTLGSSLDQAYNALLLGVDKVDVFDINVNVEKFHEVKSKLILTHPRKDLYSQVFKSGFSNNGYNDSESAFIDNLYLHNDENYELLRSKLLEDRISFINGNIFDIGNSLGKKIYDRIMLSNVIQYLEMYSINKNKYKVLKNMFSILKDHLSDEGIIQLLYYFNTKLINGQNSYDDYFDGYNLDRILNILSEDDRDNFSLIEFANDYAGKDAVVLYKKR